MTRFRSKAVPRWRLYDFNQPSSGSSWVWRRTYQSSNPCNSIVALFLSPSIDRRHTVHRTITTTIYKTDRWRQLRSDFVHVESIVLVLRLHRTPSRCAARCGKRNVDIRPRRNKKCKSASNRIRSIMFSSASRVCIAFIPNIFPSSNDPLLHNDSSSYHSAAAAADDEEDETEALSFWLGVNYDLHNSLDLSRFTAEFRTR